MGKNSVHREKYPEKYTDIFISACFWAVRLRVYFVCFIFLYFKIIGDSEKLLPLKLGMGQSLYNRC